VASFLYASASLGLPAARPTCYILFQILLGLVQAAIRILMLADPRRAGAWVRSNPRMPLELSIYEPTGAGTSDIRLRLGWHCRLWGEFT
jgi:hypothetical protein